MKIILNKKKLVKIINKEKNLGFVPTMGAIHYGHVSLIKESIRQCNKTAVSLFINKPQFGRKIDYQKYPRILKQDIFKLKRLKIDYLYIPSFKQIYPKGPNRKIKVNSFEKKLCGKFRPGHFRAVVDVINRFIKIIEPKKIFLGNKDLQQLIIIKDFVKKNYPKIKVVGCKTIRDKCGLALSSRNFLLTAKEKINACKVYRILSNKKREIIKNRKFLFSIRKKILKLGVSKIDYIKVLDINKIIKPYKKLSNYKIFIAYYFKSIRLIDNI
tara:strand:- start:1500 stop:2309 length:810 start_codon:yes stop_codon:yes gene_type:complete